MCFTLPNEMHQEAMQGTKIKGSKMEYGEYFPFNATKAQYGESLFPLE